MSKIRKIPGNKITHRSIPGVKGPIRIPRFKRSTSDGYTYYDSSRGKTNIYSPARRFLKVSEICSPHRELVREYCLICDLEDVKYYIFNSGGETSYIIAKPMLLNTLWYSPLGKELVARKI